MGLMNLLAELHAEPDLKLNLKFEIEVLCKHLQVIREDTHKKKFFFSVVGPLRFNPPYTNGLVVHATFFSFFVL